ncbi:hypothetical protein EDD17DRAFT_1517034 [Pisolithus thermaeus]|nr:hypothetical protein EDD17DRAFT_1517034 [Pisolithus thermaeus]
MCGPVHKMKWDGTTHGLAGQRSEVSQHNLLAGLSAIWSGTAQPMDGPVQQMRQDMEQDVVTNGLSRTTNDTGWDIPWAGPLLLKKEAVQLVGWPVRNMEWDGATHRWASATNEAGWDTSLAVPSKIRNDTEQLMDGPPKEMRCARAT